MPNSTAPSSPPNPRPRNFEPVTAPHLKVLPAVDGTRAVVLVLHGGGEVGTGTVRGWSSPYLRMIPFARLAHRAGRAHGVEVCLLRNRVRGWNAPALDPVSDGRWALERIRDRHPDVPVALVGHSMGGRVSLRIADDDRVVGVCALAPWTTAKDWVDPVTGKTVVIAHGTLDATTTPESSSEFAKRAMEVCRLARFEISGEGHAMLRRPAVWNRIVRAFVADAFGLPAADPLLTGAWALPMHERLTISL